MFLSVRSFLENLNSNRSLVVNFLFDVVSGEMGRKNIKISLVLSLVK